MRKQEPIRIAHIIGKWLGGGVESVVMNYYRNIDKNKIQFDFICDEDSTDIPFKEIEELGGKVILIPPYQKVFKYHKELKKVLMNGINPSEAMPAAAVAMPNSAIPKLKYLCG